MRASISVVSRSPALLAFTYQVHKLDLRKTFKFQHTHMCNAVPLVWGLLGLTPIITDGLRKMITLLMTLNMILIGLSSSIESEGLDGVQLVSELNVDVFVDNWTRFFFA